MNDAKGFRVRTLGDCACTKESHADPVECDGCGWLGCHHCVRIVDDVMGYQCGACSR